MIEAAKTAVKSLQGVEPQEDAADFLLRTTALQLADLTLKLAEEIPIIPDEHKGNIARVSIGLMEVLKNLNSILNSGGSGPPQGPPVAPGAATPHNGPMEARLTALETDMRDVRDRLVRVETKLDGKANESSVAAIAAKLDTMASKSDILGVKVQLILLGTAAWASMLFILAKGFKWF